MDSVICIRACLGHSSTRQSVAILSVIAKIDKMPSGLYQAFQFQLLIWHEWAVEFRISESPPCLQLASPTLAYGHCCSDSREKNSHRTIFDTSS